ncbi:MAG: DoxX family protein [Hyphomonadaceae bacterium]|nr:DoxX family protein [Hyphomonadaceae bacterium]
MLRLVGLVLIWALRALLAAFFLFVGYWKALGPIEALAEHRAWVAQFPDLFARAVGWSEILCAIGLLIPAFPATRRVALWSALILAINQLVALGVHAARGEAAQAAPQNVFLIVALSAIAWATARHRVTS